MPTKAIIISETNDGVYSVLVSHDGHPGHTGRKLAEHYRTPGILGWLFLTGDIAQLNNEIGSVHNGERHLKMMNHPKWKDWCLIWNRDLDGTPGAKGTNRNAILHRAGLSGALTRAKKAQVQYIYHFKCKWTKKQEQDDIHEDIIGTWTYAPVVDGKPEKFRKLTAAAPTVMLETEPA